MWQQQWPEYPGAPAANGVDWGAVAQQWMRNKEMYEQWQKQQYEQHLQMVAAAQAAQMAQSIDPAVVSNPPPPPPPLPSAESAVKSEPSADSNQAAESGNKDSQDPAPNSNQVSNTMGKPSSSLFAAYDHKESLTPVKVNNLLSSLLSFYFYCCSVLHHLS